MYLRIEEKAIESQAGARGQVRVLHCIARGLHEAVGDSLQYRPHRHRGLLSIWHASLAHWSRGSAALRGYHVVVQHYVATAWRIVHGEEEPPSMEGMLLQQGQWGDMACAPILHRHMFCIPQEQWVSPLVVPAFGCSRSHRRGRLTACSPNCSKAYCACAS